MKKNKILKALGLFGCAILLVAVSIAGTLAFMTDEETVTNTFTYGNVTITMDESDYDEYGQDLATNTLVKENVYKLVPNHKYLKNTTIHVADDSEDCYIFVKVDNGLGDKATVAISTGWTNISGTDVYYYNTVATAGEDYTAIESFTVSDDADVSALGDKKIVVTGYAVQKDGFDSATAAWTATFGKPANP